MRISDWSSDVCSSDLRRCTHDQLRQAIQHSPCLEENGRRMRPTPEAPVEGPRWNAMGGDAGLGRSGHRISLTGGGSGEGFTRSHPGHAMTLLTGVRRVCQIHENAHETSQKSQYGLILVVLRSMKRANFGNRIGPDNRSFSAGDDADIALPGPISVENQIGRAHV